MIVPVAFVIMPKKKDIWKRIVHILQLSHGKSEIDPWFSGTSLQNLSNKKAVIQVPNRFVAIWLKDHFLNELENAFVKLCGYRPQISCSYATHPSISSQSFYESHNTSPTFFHPLVAEYSFDSFIVDNSNRFAHAAALSIADSPSSTLGGPLVIFSPLTSGKTHLLHAIGNRIRQKQPQAHVAYANTRQLLWIADSGHDMTSLAQCERSLSDLDILLLDDIHLLGKNTRAQASLLSICNSFLSHQKPMVFASSQSPTSIENMDPHLTSRLQSGIIAEIAAVEQKTRFEIIKKRLAKQLIEVTDDIVFYLMNITDDIKELLSYSDKIASHIVTKQRPVELSQIKRLVATEKSTDITIRQIQDCVAQYFGVSSSELRSNSRQRRVCYCRHVAMYLCKEILGSPLKEIGEAFGKMNHSSVLYALRKIERDIDQNQTLVNEIEELKNAITYC